MSTVCEDLIVARALIDTPDKWTQNFTGLDTEGRMCAAIALRVAIGTGDYDFCSTTWRAFEHEVSRLNQRYYSIADFNDKSTHAQVLASFDRAIAATRPVI